MNDNMPLVSVIVPVYNAKSWLQASFVSWESQTYPNIEWILVDDGSTDGSAAVCKSWCDSDSSARLFIQKPNGGASSARNEGLRRARGDLVAFWDADDTQDPNMLAELVAVQQHDNEVSVCAIKRVEQGGKERDLFTCDEHTSLPQNALFEWLGGGSSTGPYTKLVPRRLLLDHGIVFDEGTINEDVLWTARVFGSSDYVCFTGKPSYQYIARPGSVTGSFGPKFLDVFENCHRLEEYIDKNFSSCMEACKTYCARECWNIAITSARGANLRAWPDIYLQARSELKARQEALPCPKTVKDKLLLLLYWSGLYGFLRG